MCVWGGGGGVEVEVEGGRGEGEVEVEGNWRVEGGDGGEWGVGEVEGEKESKRGRGVKGQ